MPKYENGKIYKLVSDVDPNFLYIGSTTVTLASRLGKHKSEAKRGRESRVYQRMREVEYRIQIILIEKFPCEDKDELRAREEFWIREFGKENLLNKNSAFSTEQDRKEYNQKLNRSEKRKDYYRNWCQSERGKEYFRGYNQGERRREYHLIYNEKRKIYRRACLELGKLTNLF